MRWLMLPIIVVSSLAPCRAAEPRTVRGTVNVPCRVYLRGEDGKHFFARPGGSEGPAVIYDVKRSAVAHEQPTTPTAPSFLAELPSGKYTVIAERGKEYAPVTQTLTVPETGDVPELRIDLKRWIDMPREDWFSGDTHVHRKLTDLPNLVEADDLHVALPLTYWVRAAYDAPTK